MGDYVTLCKIFINLSFKQEVVAARLLSHCLAYCIPRGGLYINIIVILCINLLKPTGHVIHQQFNIQQLYVLPTLYLCVLYLSENKQRLVPLTA